MTVRSVRRWSAAGLAALLVASLAGPASAVNRDTYRNPLKPQVRGDGTVDSCADPTILRGQRPGDRAWYMYCTTDPLNDRDTAGAGDVVFHPIPMLRSTDLVSWRYVGDALPTPPSWAADGAGIWAPDVVYSKAFDKYYMTFVVTNVDDSLSPSPGCESDNAIGVATSKSPTGPWTTSATPVVGPRQNGSGTDCNFYWTFDPEVLGDSIGTRGTFYYGSYYGGIFGRKVTLTRTGMTTSSAPTQVAIANRYEGANVVRRGGWYYLFASAANCCNIELTGYSVFAGRSRNPLGPFEDRDGNSFMASRVGGTPVISMNGNKWVGTGHNSVFRDYDGQWWTVYHAVNRFDPYFESEPTFTKRPVLLDPLDWRNGWPTVRAGRWASAKRMPAPASQPGEQSRYRPRWSADDRVGAKVARFSDDFSGSALNSRWSWANGEAPAGDYGVEGGALRFETQAGDLAREVNTAPVLTSAAPNGDYVVQTRVRLNVPADGSIHNFVQAGLVAYDGADKYLKLVHASIWETRQTEFAKEVRRAVDDGHRYGNTVVGTPSTWTFLRIVKRDVGDGERYTAYTRQPGHRWVRGGTWAHNLGDDARIGLVSMGGTGFTAKFDYVHVYRLGR